MIIIETESGSKWELDLEEKRIRRLSRITSRPTHNVPEDGVWRAYADLSVLDDRTLLIVWGAEPCEVGLIFRRTITSPVPEATLDVLKSLIAARKPPEELN